MKSHADTPRPWWQKLAWLVAIWAASVATLAAVAWVIKLVMTAVGMTS